MKAGREAAFRSVGATLVIKEAQRRLDALAAESVTALRSASIPCLMLRGPAIARWLYDDSSERAYEDVDLLIPVSAREEAAKVLLGLGLEPLLDGAAPSEQAPHAKTLIGEAGTVDLHWTLKGVGVQPEAVWAALGEDAEELSLAKASIRVAAPGARALLELIPELA